MSEKKSEKMSDLQDRYQEEAKTFNLRHLQDRYREFTACVEADCSFSTELVGGLPAGADGVRAFVSHHLKLEGEEAESAIRRILKEEIGERDVPSETGELKEKLSYGINVVRRDPVYGPWLGVWMGKACLKAAASRLGLFSQRRGSKGDMAEMGQLIPSGISLLEPDNMEHMDRVYIRNRSGDGPAETYFQTLRGRVSSPQGSKSIVTDVECVAPGSRFQFIFRFFPGRIKSDDVVDIFASAMIIGLGSAKAFERGKFAINRLTLTEPKRKAT